MCIKLSIWSSPAATSHKASSKGPPMTPQKGSYPCSHQYQGGGACWNGFTSSVKLRRMSSILENTSIAERNWTWAQRLAIESERVCARNGEQQAGALFWMRIRELWRISSGHCLTFSSVMNMTVPCDTGRNPDLVNGGRALDSIYRGRVSKCTATQTCSKDNQRAGKHTLWRKAENYWDQLA